MSFNTQSMGPQNPFPSAFLLAGSPAICSNCFAPCLVVIPSLQVTMSTPAMKPEPANCPCPVASQSPKLPPILVSMQFHNWRWEHCRASATFLPGGKPLAPVLMIYLEQGLITVGVGG